MRTIIVEGVDGAGKTTLAKKIAEYSDRRYVHNGGPLYTEMETWIRHYESLKQASSYRVFDRIVAVSDYVYGKVLRGKWELYHRDMFYEMLAQYNPTLIYCRPDQEVISDNLETTLDEQEAKDYKPKAHTQAVLKNLNALLAEYDSFMRSIYSQPAIELITVDPFTLPDITLGEYLYVWNTHNQ